MLLANFLSLVRALRLLDLLSDSQPHPHLYWRSFSFILFALFKKGGIFVDPGIACSDSSSSPFVLTMSSKELRIGDVVYGVGGAFNKRLRRVTKVNPSKPAVEDGTGHRGCYWKLNLSRVGTVNSRFGYCSLCKRPSEYDQPCPYSASGGK